MSSEIIGVIVGGALVTVSGILIHYVTKHLDEKRTKRRVSRAIRSEVEINQALLEPFIAGIDFWEKDSRVNIFSEILRPGVGSGKCITFERTLYLSLSDKIGLLSSEIIELVAKYYGKLHYIEAILSFEMSEPQTIKVFNDAKDAYKIGENLRKRLK